MFNKHNKNTHQKALLVYVKLPNIINHDSEFNEFIKLNESCELNIIQVIKININSIKAKYFIGKGKVLELTEFVKNSAIELTVFSSNLSPSQERNLSRVLSCSIIDRIGLILNIFAIKAQSFDGRLQVELAQLKHLSTKLIKGWTHLERQKGGIGLRGPGETQLETDKRLINKRIKYVNKHLQKVSKQRTLSRLSRIKNNSAMIAIVGYTNAGKSSMFNYLTGANVVTNNKLFSTLDSTIKKIKLPKFESAIITDTVGFVQNLPHELINAFKATLEEVRQANILMHVIDATDEYNVEKINKVNEIINEIRADKVPNILVMNKIDNLKNFKSRIDRNNNGTIYRIWVSAITGEGMNLLRTTLTERLNGLMISAKIRLDLSIAYIRNEICNASHVHNENMDEFGNWTLEIKTTNHYLYKLLNKKGVKLLWEQKCR